MASYPIHMAFAKLINEKLNMDENSIMLGSVAPDICYMGENKMKSHFGSKNEKANWKKFLYKYKEELDNPFVMGCYSHLYLDYFFYSTFIEKYYHRVKKENGESVYISKKTGKEVKHSEIYSPKGIYRDYKITSYDTIKKYKLKYVYDTSNVRNVIDEIDTNKIKDINKGINKFPVIQNKEKTRCFEEKELDKFIREYSEKFIEDIHNNLFNEAM